MKQVFISFSSRETDQAFRICKLIEDGGFSSFIAPRDLVPGEEYAAQLIENIAASKVVVLLLSKASNESPHVLREIEYAVSKKIPILVYALEPVTLTKSMEYYLMTHQWISSSGDMDRLLVQGIENAINGTAVMEPVHTEAPASDGKKHGLPEKKKKGFKILLLGILCVGFLLAGCRLFYDLKGGSNPEIPAEEIVTTEDTVVYELGDTVTFGSYQEEPIQWRVIECREDGTLVLLAKEILSLKVFDAAEAGSYNSYEGVDYWSYENHVIEDTRLQILVRGDSDWSKSNLRTWLNSEAEVLRYSDQAPTYQAVGNNFYSSEPGFLHSFTESEKNAIVPVKHSSKHYELIEIETEDMVWLLSKEELGLLEAAGISIYAEPATACLSQAKDMEEYKYLMDVMGIKSYYWWLRDSSGEAANDALAVTTEYDENVTVISGSVGICCYGVRPAICVDPSKLPQ